MAENKKGFILYADQKSLFDKLPNDKAGELIKHIFSYVNDENPKPSDLLIEIAFDPIKNQLKRDLKKFEEAKKQRSEAGKRSAKLRKEQRDSTKSTSVESRSTKSTVIDNVNVTVNDTVNDNVKTLKEDVFDFEKIFKSLFFIKVSQFFAQTTQVQKERVASIFAHKINEGTFDEFESQTNAYIDYKLKSKEKAHQWSSYLTSWEENNWIDMLKNFEEKEKSSAKKERSRLVIEKEDMIIDVDKFNQPIGIVGNETKKLG